ncbi:hypothetical protein CR513_13157, partial [Mucuna pruriens]
SIHSRLKATTHVILLSLPVFLNAQALNERDPNKSLPFRKVKVVKTTYYTINRSPSIAIGLKTLMEMWREKSIGYSSPHVLGSLVYVMHNFQEITKLDPKSKKCLFLGYANKVTILHKMNYKMNKQKNDSTSKKNYYNAYILKLQRRRTTNLSRGFEQLRCFLMDDSNA